ncbi:RICIN domain-containing protein [Plebeiibacterium marinum]|uniref:RICIN domain-containing protein n=1 Tax=Plebeiibacterium marinum TaxID=2992111 RepID=A0AAE3SKQ9_9BACT|nr:RICIN domain-containing protein [Plebeiobacterium marinum]MCW3806783.1 RICIN domain-containing protein [Plebeiobacterium marinum]
MKKILIIIPIVLLVIAAIPFILRFTKDIKKKKQYANTYALQNIQSGKDIRVHDAIFTDNAKTILYPHHVWECITWEMIQIEDCTYLLKNLYTQKTFEPVSDPKPGVSLWQKSLGGSKFQYWEFLKQDNDTYFIRLKGTELYITISSEDDDAELVLQPLNNSDSQRWKLIRQNPWI